MIVNTLETKEKLSRSPEEQDPVGEGEQAMHNSQLDRLLYGNNNLEAVGEENPTEQAPISDADQFQTSDMLVGPRVDTREVLAGSQLSSEVPEHDFSSAVVESGGGLPLNAHNVQLDAEDIGGSANDVVSRAGGKELVEESAVLTRTVSEQLDSDNPGERLSPEEAADAKNAVIGRHYMEAYMQKTDEDIEMLSKLPSGVLDKVSAGMSQMQQKYGSFREVPNNVLAIIGEVITTSAGVVATQESPDQQMLVYGDNDGELVVQTVEEAAQQIATGDKTVIESIANPELKAEVGDYVETLEAVYADGLVGADPDEKRKLIAYLVESFKVGETVE